ncbi:MAG: hypothetical protein HC786_19550 [Richelia sp. CSU_2_1]|nr:hypothetical protein [Microcoleus sp. SU_5_6]NJL66870.1 hypothetical protein [Microcoleus sp. SM1_3_4]NJR24197.1 hypothetical protein [Richelia sp. CSU_2_1]
MNFISGIVARMLRPYQYLQICTNDASGCDINYQLSTINYQISTINY